MLCDDVAAVVVLETTAPLEFVTVVVTAPSEAVVVVVVSPEDEVVLVEVVAAGADTPPDDSAATAEDRLEPDAALLEPAAAAPEPVVVAPELAVELNARSALDTALIPPIDID